MTDSWQLADRGFLGLLHRSPILPEAQQTLPRAADRLEEAKYFLELLASLKPVESNTRRANWIAGAHMVATVSIRDAVLEDLKRASFSGGDESPLARERFLRPDDPQSPYRDPVGINRAYGDLRNLRTHYGEPVIVLDARLLIDDFAEHYQDDPTNPLPVRARARWFLRQLDPAARRRLNRPLLTEEQWTTLNRYSQDKSFVSIAAQQLGLLSGALLETYESSRRE